ncbi:TonB-dependent siderophore receptor [Methylosinus sp. 3S-1]|uniref:TonB-dependent siderophore receptor n=2 Tax=Methylocystaceae TaxID=31993 RepID=A0A2D2D1C8_METT3|nr:TonB-dependent receptor [Methylosinus trichosporium]ATQ68811.1 TonB-dependent siderophore receptor [Methylosinus trichosporium OB3b]
MAGRNIRTKFGSGEGNMGSILAMALVALGAGVSDSPAEAAISPQERAGLVQNYRIPSGPLPSALNSFAELNGLQILYDSAVTSRLRTIGLEGDFSVHDGLDRLLRGTGLSWSISARGDTVSILLAQNDRGTMNDAASGATALPTIDVGAETKNQQGAQTGPRGPGDRHTGYNAGSASATLKMDTPLLKTPLSVQVVTRQTMDDRQEISVKDALITNVSGIQLTPSWFDTMLKIRGFSNTASTYKNGLIEYRMRALDTTNLQSIDVMKGPSAMLYGRVEPGGLVDLVVKRPLDTPYYSLQQQVGSYGLTRTTLDATGPLTADKTVLYRFNGEFYYTDSYRNFVTDRNVFLAPTITLHPIEQFRMNIDFEYQRRDFVDDYALYPAVGGAPANIPASRYLQEPFLNTNAPDRLDKKRIAYDWTYDFSKDWSLTNRLAYTNAGNGLADTFGGVFNPVTGVLTRSANFFPGYTDKNFTTNLDLKGKFVTGPLQHSTLVGFDYFNTFTPLYTSYFNILPSTNIYAPIYWTQMNRYQNPSFNQIGQKWTGVYGQDMISFLDDSVHVLLGGRYDWAETSANTSRTSAYAAQASYTTYYNKAFSPRVGVAYQPLPWVTVYGNFSRSFGLNSTDVQGRPIAPQRAEQWEGGVKAELLDKRLTMSLVYFDLVKSNVAARDPNNSANTMLIGKARSQGIEFDLNGRIDDNWSVIANYTHDDVRTLVGESVDPASQLTKQRLVAGYKLPASPRNYGNLWVKYDADGAFAGFSLGGGISVVESSLGDNANSFVLPGYTLLDGMIAYTTKIEGYNVTAQLNVKNLTDVAYYPTSDSRTTIQTGTPRTFLGSLRVEF